MNVNIGDLCTFEEQRETGAKSVYVEFVGMEEP